MINLSFCQNDAPMGGSFWQKDSLITLILFELCLFTYLAQSTFFGTHFKYVLKSTKLERNKLYKKRKFENDHKTIMDPL